MKLKRFTFSGGRVSHATEDIDIKLNGKDPEKVELMDLPDKEALMVIDNPGKYTTQLKNKKWKVVKKKKKKK
jgi:hypothetical protein